MSYEHRIVIGDWSHDGHNQEEYFTFSCSHDAADIKKAYKKAVNKCKVALHDERLKGVTAVCCNYEESSIKAPQLKALKNLGVSFDHMENEPEDGKLGCCPQDIAYLFFEMVKTQITDFEYKLIEEKKPINGFWSKDFNYSFGYGCFNA